MPSCRPLTAKTWGKPICRYQEAVTAARTLPSQQKTTAPVRTAATSSARWTACPPGIHQNPGMWPARYSSRVRTSIR